EGDLAAAAERPAAEMGPEVDQPVLRQPIDLLEALALDVLDGCLHQLERDPRAAELMAHRKPLDLGEFAKEADAQAARRLVADIAKKVRRAEIVAVELLLDRAILLGEVDGGADRRHRHEIVGIAREANGDRACGRFRGSSTVHRKGSLLRNWIRRRRAAAASTAAHSTRDRADDLVSAESRSRSSGRVRMRSKVGRSSWR